MTTDEGGSVTALEPGRRRRTRMTAPPDDQGHPSDPETGTTRPRRRMPGRPLKLTPEVIDAFVAALRTGICIKDACAVVGISVTTVTSWRAQGEKALIEALDRLGIGDEDDYDADDVLTVIPDDRRLFVEFLWRFSTADSIGVAELAARVHRTTDDRVAVQMLRMRRPAEFRERVEIDANLVIEESKVRSLITERLDRIGATIDTTARDTPEAVESAPKDETLPPPAKGARVRPGAQQGAVR